MIRRHSCKGVGSSVAWSLLGLAISAQSLAGTVTTDGADIVIKTKGGLEVATTDKEFSFKLGGRLQADYGRFDGYYTNNGNTADAAYFRRAYLEFGGTVYRDWKYQINYDLSRNVGNDSAGYFDEASVTYTGFNPVNLKFGRFYTDFGLERPPAPNGSPRWSATSPTTSPTGSTTTSVPVSRPARWWAAWPSSRAACSARTTTIPTATASSATTCAACSRRCTSRATWCIWACNTPIATWRTARWIPGSARAWACAASPPMAATMPAAMATVACSAAVRQSRAVEGRLGLGPGRRLGAGCLLGPGRVPAAHGQGRARPRGSQGLRLLRATGLHPHRRAAPLQAGRRQVRHHQAGEQGNRRLGLFYRYDSIKVEDDNIVVDSATREVGDAKGKTHTLGVNWYANEAVKVSANYVKAKTDKISNANGDDSGDGLVMRLQYVF